jgi:hypothetical protein
VHVNARQLAGTDVGRAALKLLARVEAQFKAFGVDPARDLEHLLVFGTPGVNRMLLVRGSFDIERLAKGMQLLGKVFKGGRIIEEDGITYCRIDTEEGNTLYAAILDKSTIVVSPELDPLLNFLKGKRGEVPATWRDFARSINPKSSITARVAAEQEVRDLLKQLGNLRVNELREMVVTLTMGKDMEVSGQVLTANNDAAKEVSDVVNFLKDNLGLVAQKFDFLKQPVDDLVKTLKVKVEGNVVNFSFQVKGVTLHKLFGVDP